MTNRIVQILGQGFGDQPAEMTVTLAGAEIFTGTVSTLPSADLPVLPDQSIVNLPVLLMSFNVPVSYSGTQSMTCSVTSGTVIFAQIVANYSPIPNPVYTPADWNILYSPTVTTAEFIEVVSQYATPAFTSEELALLESTDPLDLPAKEAILATHGVALTVSSGVSGFSDVDTQTDPRDNVTVNGIPVTPDHGSLPGTWWYTVKEGETLGYDLTITPGLE